MPWREDEPFAPGPQYIDGKKLVGWIKLHHGGLTARLGKSSADLRNIQLWQEGQPAKLDRVDRILVRLGNHILELPPDFWIETPKRRPRRKPEATEELPVAA